MFLLCVLCSVCVCVCVCVVNKLWDSLFSVLSSYIVCMFEIWEKLLDSNSLF